VFFFRTSKTLDEKYLEVKKTYELGKAQLSQTEHRVYIEIVKISILFSFLFSVRFIWNSISKG
jgi:hypothetical protein